MRNNSSYSIIITLILGLLGVKTAQAAYIDPNTGGMLFQLLAVLFGLISGCILIFSSSIKRIYFRITRYYRDRKFSNEPDDQSKTPADPDPQS